MNNYQRVIDLSKELIASIEARDGLLMQQKFDALELAYKEEFGDALNCYEAIKAFVLMNFASAKYFAHNNMFAQAHARYEEVSKRMGGFMNSKTRFLYMIHTTCIEVYNKGHEFFQYYKYFHRAKHFIIGFRCVR